MTATENKSIKTVNDKVIKYKEIEKVDRIGKGLYNVITLEGEFLETKLNHKQKIGIDAYLRHRKPDAASQEKKEEIKQEDLKEVPITEIVPSPSQLSDAPNNGPNMDFKSVSELEIRRRSYQWRDIPEYKQPGLVGYWVSKTKMDDYLQFGWRVCPRSMLKNPTDVLVGVKPGDGALGSSHVERQGLTLLINTKENRDEFNKARNQIVKPSDMAHKSV